VLKKKKSVWVVEGEINSNNSKLISNEANSNSKLIPAGEKFIVG